MFSALLCPKPIFLFNVLAMHESSLYSFSKLCSPHYSTREGVISALNFNFIISIWQNNLSHLLKRSIIYPNSLKLFKSNQEIYKIINSFTQTYFMKVYLHIDLQKSCPIEWAISRKLTYLLQLLLHDVLH